MFNYFFSTGFIYIWSFFNFFVEKIFVFLSYFLTFKKLNPRDRFFGKETLLKLEKKASKSKSRFCFLLSSAGEYEQITPLLAELRSEKDTFVCLIFVSSSGYHFAKKRKETIPFHLAPFDRLSHWKKLYQALGKTTTYVVRHELWPSFLYSASQSGPLYLINASCTFEKDSFFKKRLRKRLYQFFTKIFLVDECFQEIFFYTYGVQKEKILISGDTKYQSVLLRKERSGQKVEDLKKVFSERYKRRNFHLIAGSVWHDDTLILIKALRDLRLLYKLDMRMTIVPHELSEASLAEIENLCERHELSSVFYSKKEGETVSNPDVIIFDKMGSLAEVYALGDIAYVGGGLHSRVHNVLEPIAYGLAVAFGPRYSTSYEAIKLLSSHLAEVVHTPSEIVNWCSYHFDAKFSQKDALLNYLSEQQNATKIVLETTHARKEINYQ